KSVVRKQVCYGHKQNDQSQPMRPLAAMEFGGVASIQATPCSSACFLISMLWIQRKKAKAHLSPLIKGEYFMSTTFLPGRHKFKGLCLLLALLLGLSQLGLAQTSQTLSGTTDDKDKDTTTKKTSDEHSTDKSKSAKTTPTPEELQQMLLEQSKAME